MLIGYVKPPLSYGAFYWIISLKTRGLAPDGEGEAGGVQEWNERGVLLSRPCRWLLVLDYASQQCSLGILAANKSSYATLRVLPPNPSSFLQGDNSAREGAGVLFEGLSPGDVKFDLWVWPAHLNGTIWGDSASACQACGSIKTLFKLFVGDFQAFVSLHMNPELNLSSLDKSIRPHQLKLIINCLKRKEKFQQQRWKVLRRRMLHVLHVSCKIK